MWLVVVLGDGALGEALAAAAGLLTAQVAGLLDIVVGGAVEFLFKDGLLVDVLEFGLEVVEGDGAAVAAAALVGEGVAVVLRGVCEGAPGETSVQLVQNSISTVHCVV